MEERRKVKEIDSQKMDRIILNINIEIGREIIVEGPPMEALLFKGARKGSIITMTDSKGEDFRGRVTYINNEKANIVIFDKFPIPTEPPIEIILIQALPNKERMEWIIQKATELGVTSIIPFKSKKSISLEERESKQRKAHKWQDIARKASEQCRRARVPKIETYQTLEEVVKIGGDEALKIILWEKEGIGLNRILKGNHYKKICVMIGPEGGFTDDEVSLAIKNGFIPVKLGQRILRTETAAITIIGIIQFELGDLK